MDAGKGESASEQSPEPAMAGEERRAIRILAHGIPGARPQFGRDPLKLPGQLTADRDDRPREERANWLRYVIVEPVTTVGMPVVA
jgi:hypothetical protein